MPSSAGQMSELSRARGEMETWARDLEILRPHMGSADNETLQAAWTAARAKFLDAVEKYTKAVNATK